MKEAIKIIAYTFLGVATIACLSWFIIWCFSDPFNIVPDLPKSNSEIATEGCNKIGKVADFTFTGRFVECKEVK